MDFSDSLLFCWLQRRWNALGGMASKGFKLSGSDLVGLGLIGVASKLYL